MTWENSGGNYEASETDRSIKGAFKGNKEGGSEHKPPKGKSPWKSAVLGAVIGWGLFIVLIVIMGIVFAVLH